MNNQHKYVLYKLSDELCPSISSTEIQFLCFFGQMNILNVIGSTPIHKQHLPQ